MVANTATGAACMTPKQLAALGIEMEKEAGAAKAAGAIKGAAAKGAAKGAVGKGVAMKGGTAAAKVAGTKGALAAGATGAGKGAGVAASGAAKTGGAKALATGGAIFGLSTMAWAGIAVGVLGAAAIYGYMRKKKDGGFDQSETDVEIQEALG